MTMLMRLLLITSLGILLRGTNVAPADEMPAHEQHLSELVQAVVLAAVPKDFEDDRHWDRRRDVFAGVRVRSRGLKLRISKRTESVRHGLWRRHTITLVDPERTLKIRISDFEPQGSGSWTFTVTADVKVNVDARFEHWNLGVKLLNGSVNADTVLRMMAACALSIDVENDPEMGQIVVFAPEVKTVDLYLRNLDVHKFGQLRGDAATDVFDGMEDVVEDLLQTQEDSIRGRARNEISRRKEEMRMPLASLLTSPWGMLWLAQ
jgi:hypothetical protein